MTLDRTEILRRGIVPAHSLALEIGALDKPILPKPMFDVRYLDYAPTKVLSKKYATDPNVGDVLDVDIIWNGSSPLAGAVEPGQHFDAVVASHVVEHIPDPVQWLAHFASVLRPGGIVSLAVPDMRFSFDYNRRLSEFGDVLDAHLRRAVVPSFAQLYEFHTKAIPVDTAAVWAGVADYDAAVRPGDLHQEAFDCCLALRDGGPYVDVHCHTFTPLSFVSIIERLGDFDLIDFAILDLIPTQLNSLEFFVKLERLRPDLSDAQKKERQKDGISIALEAIQAGPVPVEHLADAPAPEPAPLDAPVPALEPAHGVTPLLVSDRERALIELKRKILTSLRRGIRRNS